MKKYARKCDVTGKGMNEGWVWGDGAYYTSTKEMTIKRLKEKVKDGVLHLEDDFTEEEIINISDEELLEWAFDEELLFWTQWDPEEDDTYYDKDGNLYDGAGNLITE